MTYNGIKMWIAIGFLIRFNLQIEYDSNFKSSLYRMKKKRGVIMYGISIKVFLVTEEEHSEVPGISSLKFYDIPTF